ncbi:glycoside hydrolase/deacetylase [Schizopora paradoxa]|uniref:chitin deacetylase n=1 Tax=Schizopora paradoxa TaxID=27342 RepID=A0A0H2SS76_9AGAM|nr:glycoside hydrolase/deacetylase [Schizopora paradoxa]
MLVNAGIFTAVLGAACTLVSAHPHAHKTRSALPGDWVQSEDHPVYELFRRTNLNKRQSNSTANSTSGIPAVGSSAWTALYPQGSADTSNLPAAWTNALNAAVAAGQIPNVPQSSLVNGNPTYPNGANSQDESICSGNGGGPGSCRTNGSIWDAPDGMVAIGFDDGPTQFSPTLYTFLQQNNQKATHFMIGVNILNNWQAFLTAFNTNGDDIAVHTWTHPYMTTLSNIQVLGELAMTMQIIHDSTGGKLPRFWRPPYGDIDNRVNAIAQTVLGLTAIIWNHDTEDWAIPSGGQTLDGVNNNMQQWLTGPKSPGLIILEHELYQQTVQAFMTNYPLMAQNGWKTVSTVVTTNQTTYQNGTLVAGDSDNAFSVSVSTTSTSSSAASSSTASTNSTATGSGSSAEASGKSAAVLRAQTPSMRVMTAVFGVVAAFACASL